MEPTRSQILENRTSKLALEILNLCKKYSKSILTDNIIEQLLRSGTSIGANYREANGASSKRDFKNKILICKRECKETEYWLQMLANANENNALKDICRKLWQETHEFTLIFSKSAANTKC